MSDFIAVGTLDDIADNTAKLVELNGQRICLARSNGTVFAIGDTCSHADVSLSEGEVSGGHVECWLHGSNFDLATGRPIGLPATQPVPTYPVKVEGDTVLVCPEALS